MPGTILGLAESVLIRPRMDTCGGSFRESAAFLVGFAAGLAQADPMSASAVEWNGFLEFSRGELRSSALNEDMFLSSRPGTALTRPRNSGDCC